MFSIYKPLGAKGGEYSSRDHTETPPATLERCSQLFEAFSELKTDMMEEVKDIEKKLIIPAQLARDSLKPMKKAIKLREDKKACHFRLLMCICADCCRLITNDTKVAQSLFRTRRPAPTGTIRR